MTGTWPVPRSESGVESHATGGSGRRFGSDQGPRGVGVLDVGDGVPPVLVSLTWDGPRRLSVEHLDGTISVLAHAGLSEANVVDACADLDPVIGGAVLSAWRTEVQRPR